MNIMQQPECILFDLDGVLVDACDWHFEALNRALVSIGKPAISKEDHISTYNGLPTSIKLNMLGLNKTESRIVWEKKQQFTLDTIQDRAKTDSVKIELLSYLCQNSIQIACVTNSIRQTAEAMLKHTGQYDYIHLLVSNEDVERNKPYPDCYNYAMKKMKVDPSYCLCVEDSPKGIEAAEASDARMIWKVENSQQVTLKNYLEFVS
jgi:beta-phosphoglucomutase